MDTKTCVACFRSIDVRASKCPECLSLQGMGGALHRGSPRRLLAGVCASIAEQFGIAPLLARVVFLFGLFITGGLVVWLYLALWLLTPPDAFGVAPLERWIRAIKAFFAPRPVTIERVPPPSPM